MIKETVIHDEREGNVGHGTLTECSWFGRDIEHLQRYLDIFAWVINHSDLGDDGNEPNGHS